ncbi:hypothetical protein [Saccharothrix syringae]|uniref:Uncharacterized protein n=1 Tax=Saccharothrix syringae TaxID=103733 RepID=A0A5Q0HBG8_SACSY|nr:hypothetical protein [Saccharothrix syringae]QFZ23519.1 hypothetical protein EKG83_44195 [Saccharothrix syringae]
MSELLIGLAALGLGVVVGLVVRHTGRAPARPDDARELLNAADDLEYGLNAVLNFGPLSSTELTSVDLVAKYDRLVAVGGVDQAVLGALRDRLDQIALHPYPEQHQLFAAVREDEAAVWLALRDAVGSGAAQHAAASEARRLLDDVRRGRRGAPVVSGRELVRV